MKSVKQHLEEILVNKGMFPQQAQKVIEKAIPELNSLVPDYKITWDRPWMEYPEQLYTVWWIGIKPIALKWIEENCPQAWYKPLFL